MPASQKFLLHTARRIAAAALRTAAMDSVEEIPPSPSCAPARSDLKVFRIISKTNLSLNKTKN